MGVINHLLTGMILQVGPDVSREDGCCENPEKYKVWFFLGGERGVAHWGWGVLLEFPWISNPNKKKRVSKLLPHQFDRRTSTSGAQQGMAPLGVLPLHKIQFWCGFKLMVVSETSLIVMSRGHKKWPDGGNSHIFDFSPRKFWGRWTKANLRRSYFFRWVGKKPPTRRWGPLTTLRGFIPGYTHLQPFLNRVCWGYNYLITRGAPSCRWSNISNKQSLSRCLRLMVKLGPIEIIQESSSHITNQAARLTHKKKPNT